MKTILKYFCLIVLHLGMGLIIVAMSLSYCYNWHGKAVLLKTDKTNIFLTKNGEIKIVPYALTLSQLHVSFYDSGKPKKIEAIISIEGSKEIKTFSLHINNPYKLSHGQDLYLVNFDQTNPNNPEWCVIECVYDPFQHLFFVGIILVIVGLLLSLTAKIFTF